MPPLGKGDREGWNPCSGEIFLQQISPQTWWFRTPFIVEKTLGDLEVIQVNGWCGYWHGTYFGIAESWSTYWQQWWLVALPTCTLGVPCSASLSPNVGLLQVIVFFLTFTRIKKQKEERSSAPGDFALAWSENFGFVLCETGPAVASAFAHLLPRCCVFHGGLCRSASCCALPLDLDGHNKRLFGLWSSNRHNTQHNIKFAFALTAQHPHSAQYTSACTHIVRNTNLIHNPHRT